MTEVSRLGHIAYTVRGEGEPLFLVGAPAGLAGFAQLAEALSADFLIVTHDPRGIGASGLVPGAGVEPEALAEDLAALIEHVAGPSATVFGSSGGAVTALSLLRNRPELVGRAVLHEPPLFSLLADAEDVLARAGQAFATARTDPQAGLQMFSDLTQLPRRDQDGRTSLEPLPLPALPPAELARHGFALGTLAPALVNHRVPLPLPAGADVSVAAGEHSRGQPAAEAAAALAGLLDVPLLVAPGSHFAPTTLPAAFASWLERTLKGEAQEAQPR